MKSKWVRFLLLTVVGFGLGAAFALFQESGDVKTPTVQEQPAKPVDAEVRPEDLPKGALPLSESVSKPEMMAGTPVGGAFSLVDHKGNPVTEKSWPGKQKLVFFGFTHCPDVCGVALQKVTVLMEQLDPQGEKIVPLFVTVDPARDTKEVMAAFIANFSPHIVGLTGTQEQVDGIVSAYKVFAAKIPNADDTNKIDEEVHKHDTPKVDNNYMVDHSAYIYLMSSDDKLLATFGPNEEGAVVIEKVRKNLTPATVSTP